MTPGCQNLKEAFLAFIGHCPRATVLLEMVVRVIIGKEFAEWTMRNV
jgi:hypothetical protein